ncbi:MAG: hypothetical protein GC204_00005 [Chloroflexi bacterium]|nr:hypothetical protein [Chloroflexota bacterium]
MNHEEFRKSRTLRTLMLLGVMLLMLVAAACSPNRITGRNPATLRDQIFSVEPRQNGTVSIWMVHDNVGTYCTANGDLINKINTIFRSADPSAYVSYRTFQIGDPACGQEGDADSGFHTYLITDIQPVSQ